MSLPQSNELQSSQFKPILCLDFDGVIHSYVSGWQGATVIPDEPVPGAIDFIERALPHFRVAIYSSRSSQPGGITAMQSWLAMHVRNVRDNKVTNSIMEALEWPQSKPSAFVTIDDRALTFTGVWPSIGYLINFTPWNKSPKREDADPCTPAPSNT